jgi:hypothetical protein
MDAAAHRPEVDDVANQKGLFRRIFTEKIKETLGLAGACAEVNVGEKN